MKWWKETLLTGFALCVFAPGCAPKPHPGNWGQTEVRAKVKESLKLSELTLTPDPAGGFQGVGKNSEGESFKIKITQDVAAKKLSWDSKGDRGSNEEGNVSFQ